MKVKLTPGFVLHAPLPAPTKDREIYWDTARPGFGLMITRAGEKRFVIQYRVGPESRRMHLRRGLSITDAQKEARKLIGDIARGLDPLAERKKAAGRGADTFRAIAEEYLRREGSKLRTAKQRAAVLARLVYPKLGSRPIGQIRKSDIVRLLDGIEDKIGAPTADLVLAIVGRIMNWQAKRSDDFKSPIVRGMGRTGQKERARTRILTDCELRSIWQAAETATGVFGPYVQFLLATGARRTEAARMADTELSGNIWTIPGSRYKNKIDHVVPLSPLALAALARLAKISGRKFIFSGDGRRPLSGYSKVKAKFDRECGVTGWTLHDLRRTARSLMSRAGVDSDIAERCMGHVLPAMRATYDRHSYLAEKQRAFEVLAALIQRIIEPQANNVIAIGER